MQRTHAVAQNRRFPVPQRRWRFVAAHLCTVLIGVLALLPWQAHGAITLTIVQSPTFSALQYSNSVDQTNSGTLRYHVSTNALLTTQITVSIVASTLTYSGSHSGANLPASQVAVTSIGEPAPVSGTLLGAPTRATATGPIDTARAVLRWQFGLGLIIIPPTYAQTLTLQLTIPRQSLAGTYSSVITLTSATSP